MIWLVTARTEPEKSVVDGVGLDEREPDKAGGKIESDSDDANETDVANDPADVVDPPTETVSSCSASDNSLSLSWVASAVDFPSAR